MTIERTFYAISFFKSQSKLGKMAASDASCSTSTNTSCYLDRKIVIVGAGISGLASASHLKDLGFKHVCLLEARDRVGGRIHTIDFDSNCIEIGAQWIHGKGRNIIYELAFKNELVSEEFCTFDEKLSKGLPKNLSESEKHAVAMLLDFLKCKTDSLSPGCSLSSVYDYIYEQFRLFLASFNEDLVDVLKEAFEWYCRLVCELNGCLNLSSLSLKLLSNYSECEGNLQVDPKKGYCRILDIFFKNLPKHWVLTNKIVSSIDWSDFNINGNSVDSEFLNFDEMLEVQVSCQDGSVYTANHVIVTLPLGCLKKCSETLFRPPLKSNKQQAIHLLGFGVLNKIFLQFDYPFWVDMDVEEIYVFWKKSYEKEFLSDSKLEKNSICNSKSVPGLWIRCVYRFSILPNNPNTLCAWLAGEGVDDMERLPDDRVAGDCVKLLQLVLHIALPLPKRIFRSAWFSDPFSCGSYSYLSVDCEEKGLSNCDLAEPEYGSFTGCMYPVLMFAGEATHDCYFSTVHGAYETGIREANRIFDFYKTSWNRGSILEEESIVPLLKDLSLKCDLHINQKIVIVGAGISGLACALHLVKNHFSEVTVLEALEEVGGRVKSISYGDQNLELGAQWVHGTDNDLYSYLEANKLLSPNTDSSMNEGKGTFFTSDGCAIEDSIVDEMKQFFHFCKCQMESGESDVHFAKSVLEFYANSFTSYQNNILDDPQIALKRGLYEWYKKFEMIDNACDDLNNVAVQSYSEWDQCPDEMYHINVKRFSSLFDCILKELPKEIIFLNKPVKRIKWSTDGKCEHTSRGDSNREFPVTVYCENEEFRADTVIVTASAGFLKENMTQFFSPPLPENKQKAILNLGYGTINKVFLVYDKPFWKMSDIGFQLIWTDKMTAECKKLVKEHPWITGMTGLDVIPERPILVGWFGGEEAKLMESIDEEVVQDACTSILRNFLSKKDIPYPIKLFRSCWYKNPYSRGAYSYRPICFYESDDTLQNLQNPICSKYITNETEMEWPVVMFAGEAFDDHSFSSAHGAFRSGINAAKCLCKAVSNLK